MIPGRSWLDHSKEICMISMVPKYGQIMIGLVVCKHITLQQTSCRHVETGAPVLVQVINWSEGKQEFAQSCHNLSIEWFNIPFNSQQSRNEVHRLE